MKRFLEGLIVVLVLMFLVGFENVSANTVDNIGPKCSMSNTVRIKLFKTAKTTLSCYDTSDLDDVSISPSDFTISKTFFIILLRNIANC